MSDHTPEAGALTALVKAFLLNEVRATSPGEQLSPIRTLAARFTEREGVAVSTKQVWQVIQSLVDDDCLRQDASRRYRSPSDARNEPRRARAWRQVAIAIELGICAGDPKAGAALGTRSDLAARFGLSDRGVEQILSYLRAREHIPPRQDRTAPIAVASPDATRLASMIRHRIVREPVAAGTRLGDATELSDRYGVPLATVRAATGLLWAAGWVETRDGGSRVGSEARLEPLRTAWPADPFLARF